MEGDCIHSLVVAVGSSAATRPEGAMEEEPPLFPGKMRERCVDATAVGGGRKRALAAIAVERAGAGIDARESIPRTPLSQRAMTRMTRTSSSEKKLPLSVKLTSASTSTSCGPTSWRTPLSSALAAERPLGVFPRRGTVHDGTPSM